MYNVLWIDDQHKNPELISFALEAEAEGIILDGYPSFEEGFEALENKLAHYDVILLDGLFFEKKGQELGTEDEKGIGKAIAKINELKRKKVFPWFVLSGKDKFTKGENALLVANEAKCFDKTNPSDVLRLFEEIKLAASEQPDTQLKFKYANLLAIGEDHLIGAENHARLFDLIKSIESDSKIDGAEDKLTTIRKIVEALFAALGKYEIIPSEMVGQRGWINGSSLFLSGKHNDYHLESEIVPPLIAYNIHKLLEIIQDGSHAYGDLKFKVDQYIRNAQSDYFFRSCVFLLFDLLLWFKEFMEKNGDIDANKAKWKSKVSNGDWMSGSVIRIADNGWGTFQPDGSNMHISIPPKMVTDNELKENNSIKVIAEETADKTKMHIKAISKEL